MAAAVPSPSVSQADEIIAKKWVLDVIILVLCQYVLLTCSKISGL